MQSLPYKLIFLLKLFAECGKTAGGSSHRYDLVVASVSILFGVVSPNAVQRLVTQGIIDSFNRPTFLSWTHLGQKSLKRQPLLAHGNASCTVPLERCAVGIDASLDHGRPHVVNSGSGQPMSGSAISDGFSAARTSTRLRRASAQTFVALDAKHAAVTQAPTIGATPAVTSNPRRSVCEDNYPSKSPSNKGFSGRHNVRLSISNVVFSGERLVPANPRCDNQSQWP